MTGFYQDVFTPGRKLRHLTLDWTGARVVDLGCNLGALGDYVLARGAASYVGVEADAGWAEEGRRRFPHLDIRTGTAGDADTDCDILCCLGLFHHVPDAGVSRILSRTTARVVVCEQPMGEPFGVYRMRSEAWYRARLTKAGFTSIERVEYGFGYPVDRAILVGRRA